MMSKISTGFILFIIIIFNACTSSLSNKQQAEYIDRDGLIGEWTCYKRFLDYNVEKTFLAPDADYHWLEGVGNLIFTKDSMFYFDYPREYHKSYQFDIDSNRLMLQHTSTEGWEFDKIELKGDSLVRVIGKENTILWTEYYVRDTFDQAIINTLLQDSVNVEELVGVWYLEKSYQALDGSDPYVYDFPFELPDSLIITQENIKTYEIKGRTITLDIEGERQSFRFGFKQDNEYGYTYLDLEPTNWYRGERDFPIRYN